MLVDDWLCDCGNEFGGIVVKLADVSIGDAGMFDNPSFGLPYQRGQFSRGLNRRWRCVFDVNDTG